MGKFRAGDMVEDTRYAVWGSRRRIEHYGSNFVVFRVFAPDGKDLGERCMPREDFDLYYTKVPAEPVSVPAEGAWLVRHGEAKEVDSVTGYPSATGRTFIVRLKEEDPR